MTIVDLNQAAEGLEGLLERAESGEEILIARNGHAVVQLVPRRIGEHPLKPRVGGQLEGKMWISPDFDAPLDDEIARAFGMIDE